jgi:hypothetical protein
MEAIITSIVTLLSVFLTSYFTYLRQKDYNAKKFNSLLKDNEEIKEQISEIDKKQNIEIQSLKVELSKINISELHTISDDLKEMQQNILELTELHRYTTYSNQLKRIIEVESEDKYEIKDLKNSELKRALDEGIDKAFKIYDDILAKDFVFDFEKLKRNIYTSLKSLKSNISAKKLCLLNPEEFLEELENIIWKKQVENFLFCMKTIVKPECKNKKTRFEECSKDLIINIISETIDCYNEYVNGQQRVA